MSINIIKGKFPHVAWVDIERKGILTEIAIMKNSETGLMFIKLNGLDAIDKQRLFRIITNRNAHMYDLWELMGGITLGNGSNALEYFHQYVKVLSPSGEVIAPQMGRMAAPEITGMRKHQPNVNVQAQVAQAQVAQAPVAQAPVAQDPVGQAPVAQDTVSRPVSEQAVNVQPVSKQPASNVKPSTKSSTKKTSTRSSTSKSATNKDS
jgi:hypothetical protein